MPVKALPAGAVAELLEGLLEAALLLAEARPVASAEGLLRPAPGFPGPLGQPAQAGITRGCRPGRRRPRRILKSPLARCAVRKLG